MNNKNRWLVFLVIFLVFFSGVLVCYIVYDKLINDKSSENVSELDKHEDMLMIGLDLYKFATGDGSGPFRWENDKVVNYVSVISKFTQEYFDSFSVQDNGFSLPYLDSETGRWYVDNKLRIPSLDKFVSIVIESQTEDMVMYKVSYEAQNIDNGQWVNTGTFVIRKIDNDWKIDSFKLVYGLKF